jgi:hypothetical protein
MSDPETVDVTLREALAALIHTQWSGWMAYVFQLSDTHLDGSVTIPPALVARWKRQIATPYAGLSNAEQESDRIEADRIFDLIGDYLFAEGERD